GKAKVDVHVLNAATFAPEKSFTLEHTLAFWAPSDELLISSNPAHSYADGQVGALDFDGNWSAMKTDVPMQSNACRLGMNAVDQERVVLYGCDAFIVLSTGGKHLFTHNDSRLVFVTALATGRYLAVRCDRYRLEATAPSSRGSIGTRADRIEVYDLESRKRRMSIPIRGGAVQYRGSFPGDPAGGE